MDVLNNSASVLRMQHTATICCGMTGDRQPLR